ncbi:18374_t:CDS:2 [Entrophospora sp. SA101]|nr:18374_t:CDS:2 [Entrophospora sp. SA101]
MSSPINKPNLSIKTQQQQYSIDPINESSLSSSIHNATLQDIAIGINKIENILLDFTKQMSLLNENISQIIINQSPLSPLPQQQRNRKRSQNVAVITERNEACIKKVMDKKENLKSFDFSKRDLQNLDKELDDPIDKFENMRLRPELLRGILNFGGIPLLLNGLDVIAQTQIGQEKIATYSITILQNIEISNYKCQALIVTSTIESAEQIYQFILGVSNLMTNLECFMCTGGANNDEDVREIMKLKPHIIIGTWNRIYDLVNLKSIDLSYLKIFVIDELDMLIQQGFKDQAIEIRQQLPFTTILQTLLFTSNITSEMMDFSNVLKMREPIKMLVRKSNDQKLLSSPPLTSIPLSLPLPSSPPPPPPKSSSTSINNTNNNNNNNLNVSASNFNNKRISKVIINAPPITNSNINNNNNNIISSTVNKLKNNNNLQSLQKLHEQQRKYNEMKISIKQYYRYIAMDKGDWKLETLNDFFDDIKNLQTIIYCNKEKTIEKICYKLALKNLETHEEMTSTQRESILTKFLTNKVRILVTTCVLIQGNDICEFIPLIINYDLPASPEIYGQRISCASSNTKQGIVISIINSRSKEMGKLRNIEEFYKFKMLEMPDNFTTEIFAFELMLEILLSKLIEMKTENFTQNSEKI